jgi:hypothetical protein
MGLSDDQRAMLRLLAQREQGYEDIAALMGLSVDEVRAKVKDALGQLEEEGAPAPVLPPEPAAAAPEPAAAAPEPDPVPEPEPPVAKAEPQPQVESAPQPPAPQAPAAPPRASSPRPQLSLPSEPGPRAALAAGVAVVILLIVVILVSGGGDSGSDTTTANAGTEASTAAETPGSTEVSSKEVTQATLSAVDGSEASGVATFGRIKNTLALQVEAKGLAPTGQGQSYTIWLAQSPQKMLPLASTAVTENGEIGAQVEVPTEVLAYLAAGTFDQMTVTLTEDATLKASLAKASSEKKSPVYTGTEVLSGQVTGPIVGAGKKTGE